MKRGRAFTVVLALISLALSAVPAVAQSFAELSDEIRALVALQGETVPLSDVRLIDGSGAPPADRQTVLIRGSRIVVLGPSGSVVVPPGAMF